VFKKGRAEGEGREGQSRRKSGRNPYLSLFHRKDCPGYNKGKLPKSPDVPGDRPEEKEQSNCDRPADKRNDSVFQTGENPNIKLRSWGYVSLIGKQRPKSDQTWEKQSQKSSSCGGWGKGIESRRGD